MDEDITVDRLAPRQRLLAALDEVISEKLNPAHHIDAVESKLFGIGAESYTVGSNEFYMGYATSRQTALCLDAGHFHPTEVISDKDRRHAVCAAVAAARQPSGSLGQRSRSAAG
ncbi:L-rhamnose isomerase [Escherichia coli]